MSETCLHNANALVDARLVYVEDAGRYHLDVEARCGDCGTRFEFLGLPVGSHPQRPTVSMSGLTLRAPVRPDAHKTSMLAGETDPEAPDAHP